MRSIIFDQARGLRGVAIAATLSAVCFCALGCGGEEKKEPSPDEVKKAQQQQMETMRREMQNQ